MNWKLKNLAGTTPCVFGITSMLVTGLIPGTASAVQYVLTDNNSSVFINADSEIGMNTWSVDGQTQLYKQWFFYSVGNAGASPINALSAPNVTGIGPNYLDVTYASSQFSISAAFTLQGGAAGSGSASVGEVLTIQNLGTTALPFHFYNYTDFDLGGTYAGDTVQLNQNLAGLFTTAEQSKGGVHFADAIISPGADHGQASLSPTLWNELNSTAPTTLDDYAGPVTGDATWALEWDPVIAAGGSFTVTITKSVSVPEPGVWSLAPMGLLLFGFVKRIKS